MESNNVELMPGSPAEWYDLGISLRKKALFGEAVNAFGKAAEMAEKELAGISCRDESEDAGEKRKALEQIRSGALASIELIGDITGFVNADLMNP